MSRDEKEFLKSFQLGLVSREEVYDRYYRLIRYFVCKHINPQDAEDCIQDCCIELFPIAMRFDIERGYRFSTYLLSELRRIRTNYQRRIARARKRNMSLETLIDEYNFDAPEVQEQITDFSDKFKAAISSLNEVEKNIIYLHYFKELTYPEIGKRLDIPRSTVAYYEKRALAKMRMAVEHSEMIDEILEGI